MSGRYAYVADSDSGLRVIDVSNPANPREVGSFDTPGTAEGVAILNGCAFVADGGFGLRVIDISEPAHPYETGYYDTPGYARGVAVGDSGLVFVADSSSLGVYDCSEAMGVSPDRPISVPASFSLAPAFPNPFNSSTIISYTLPIPGWYAVDVMDLNGRIVTRLDGGYLQAGSYHAVWNAGSAAAGVYLVKMEAGGFNQTRKVVLVK